MPYPIVRCFDVQNKRFDVQNKRFGTKTIVSILFRKNKKKNISTRKQTFRSYFAKQTFECKKRKIWKNLNYLICRSEPLGLIDFCFFAAKKGKKK
jgi:hypothetical protein